MRPDAGGKQNIHQHSGWLIPLGFALVILALCGLLLGWYLRPGIGSGGAPSSESRPVHLQIQGLRLAVPANYIASPAARAGGDQNSVTLAALYPGFQGYTAPDAHLFAGNAPDSPVIRMTLRGGGAGLSLHERLERVYRPYLRAAAGTPGPFGLTRYDFAGGYGYEGNELFAGTGARGLELFLWNRPGPAVPSPNCMALDRPFGKANLSWRFKRAQLAHWRAIADGVYDLIGRFEAAD